MIETGGLWAPLEGIEDQSESMKDMICSLKFAFGAPRILEKTRAYLKRNLPLGTYLIYGAGSHTEAIFDAVQSAQRSILGTIDQRGEQMTSFHGLPVYTPEQIGGLDYDWILLSHTCRELDMSLKLDHLGVKKEKILPVYAHAEFIDASRDWMDEKPEPRDHVIIRAGRSSIIEDKALQNLFPPEKTNSYFIGRADYFQPSDSYKIRDLNQSLLALEQALTSNQPKSIYLSTGWFNNFLYPVIRSMAPQAKIIHEIFDWCVLYHNSGFLEGSGLSSKTILWNILGEYASCKESNLIVSKRFGTKWKRAHQTMTATYCPYFSNAQPCSQNAFKMDSHLLKIAYAGILPPAKQHHVIRHGYQFLHILEELSHGDPVQIDIFNALHESSSQDGLFKTYLASYNDGRLKYHRRLGYKQLVKQLSQYDFGWLIDVNHERPEDKQWVIPDRAVGYLAAGLPLLIDSGWGHLSELVQQYGAGIVFDNPTPGSILAEIRNCDRSALLIGARDLNQHLLEQNKSSIGRIKTVLAT